MTAGYYLWSYSSGLWRHWMHGLHRHVCRQNPIHFKSNLIKRKLVHNRNRCCCSAWVPRSVNPPTYAEIAWGWSTQLSEIIVLPKYFSDETHLGTIGQLCFWAFFLYVLRFICCEADTMTVSVSQVPHMTDCPCVLAQYLLSEVLSANL